ncbi:MAG: non-ribosomal peptide synthetase [Flammeovirgaceae bacterium]
MISVKTFPQRDLTIVKKATHQQRGIFFHALENGVTYWNFINVKSFSGIVDIAAVKKTIELIMQRHSSLRTNFLIEDDELVQIISEEVRIDEVFTVKTFVVENPSRIKSIVDEQIEEFKGIEFKFESSHLIKFALLTFNDVHYFVLVINHICTDASSMQIFWNEFYEFYNLHVTSDDVPLNVQLPKQYHVYTDEQLQFLQTETYNAQVQFWLAKMADGIHDLNFPFLKKNHGATQVLTSGRSIPNQLETRIRTLTLQKRVIYSSIYLLAYSILIHKYTGEVVISIGNVSDGRGTGKRNNDIIGMFVNRLFNVIRLDRKKTILELLHICNEEMIGSFSNANVHYEELRRLSSVPLPKDFEAAFNFIKYSDAPFLRNLELTATPDLINTELATQYDLQLFIFAEGQNLRVQVECRCNALDRDLPPFIVESYFDILEKCMNCLDTKLEDLNLLSQMDHKSIKSFNASPFYYKPEYNVNQFFTEQVRHNSCETAVIFKNEKISYMQLDSLANRMLSRLLGFNIKRGSIVGIFLPRSIELIASMLAVIKGGYAFLCLDQSYPKARIDYMIEDSGVKYVISDDELEKILPAHTVVVKWENIAEECESQYLPTPLSSKDLLYVIYTSGSTGNPKGVRISHAGVNNLIRGMNEIIPFRHKRIYSLTPISFDIFIVESIVPLCSGGTIVLGCEDEQKYPDLAIKVIQDQIIDVFQTTPARLRILLQEPSLTRFGTISLIIVGGEKFSKDIVEQIEPHYSGRLINIYGPTEDTVWTTYKEVNNVETITVGKPMLNKQIHILNEFNEVQGIGVYGEVCISGEGVTEGYIDPQNLYGKKFITKPEFTEYKLYKSGDVGRILANGELQIEGRKDNQVKVRGYRIELEEIEHALRKHQLIKDAVVVGKLVNGYHELCGCYISSEELKREELTQFLKTHLPLFMIPQFYFRLISFPMTSSQKIDRQTLSEQINIEATIKIHSEVCDQQLLSIWCSVLKMITSEGDFSMDVNFFEVGGHSLKAIQLLKKIREQLGVKIPLKDFFKNPTLALLNDCVSSFKK